MSSSAEAVVVGATVVCSERVAVRDTRRVNAMTEKLARHLQDLQAFDHMKKDELPGMGKTAKFRLRLNVPSNADLGSS